VTTAERTTTSSSRTQSTSTSTESLTQSNEQASSTSDASHNIQGPDLSHSRSRDGGNTGTAQNVIFTQVDASHRSVGFGAGMKIGEQVSDYIKEKIWSHKYIEFATLLSSENEEEFSLSFQKSNNQPTIKLLSKPKRKLREHEWNLAFDTFLSIYVTKYPRELNELLTYGQSIKLMMNRGENWNFYDKQFRISREYSRCSWDLVRVDLMIQGQSYINRARIDSKPENSKDHIPAGYCFRYHSPKFRCHNGTECSFKHNCPRCQKIHQQHYPCKNPSEQNKPKTNSYPSSNPQRAQ